MPIAALQAWGQLTLLQQAGVLPFIDFGLNLPTLSMVLSMIAGTMFLVWLGELITERGLGNGISLIIFGGIVARFPQVVGQGLLESDEGAGLLLLGIFAFAVIFVIVLFTEAQRRVPVQYGRSVFRGGRMQRQSGSTFLPLRVNSAGMIPLIFAFSIVILPGTIASYFRDPLSDGFVSRFAQFFADSLDPTAFPYWALGVRAGGDIHLLLYAGDIPAAGLGGQLAAQRGVHSGHTPGPANAGISDAGC